jgi:preprotein translocase subunit SecE
VKALEFFREVKVEFNKVFWPQKQEVLSSSIVVIIASVIAGVFFLLVDSIIYKLIQLFLGI